MIVSNNDTMEQVIADGMHFMRSLCLHYGNDKGLEIWEALGDAMGTEVKGKILFAMVNGGHADQLRFRALQAESLGNAVTVIKTIRHYTGYGLKEAKDLWDNSKNGFVTIRSSEADMRAFRESLRDLGCEVF